MTDDSAYVGKHLLVGLTYVDHNQNVVDQLQLHGQITRINNDGIFFLQPNGDEFSLPPDVDSLRPAPKGSYRLRATGEVVIDPDLIASWKIYKRAPDEGN